MNQILWQSVCVCVCVCACVPVKQQESLVLYLCILPHTKLYTYLLRQKTTTTIYELYVSLSLYWLKQSHHKEFYNRE